MNFLLVIGQIYCDVIGTILCQSNTCTCITQSN